MAPGLERSFKYAQYHSKRIFYKHGEDPVAYRRDRRKDQLLQENGYLVLRYLAEDLAKELDSVLDAILRALSARRNTTVIPIEAVRRSGV